EIVVRRSRDIEPVEHSAAVAVGSNGVARSGKIGPRRKERSRRWKRITRTAKSDHERECQPTSCRFARHDDALRRITGAQKCTVERHGVLHGGRKPMLGRKTIVRSENAKPMERIVSGDGTVRFCRAAKISSAVKIEKHSVARRRTFEAFTGNTAEMRGRNLNCWRNLVGIGAKNLARD